jgi:hypothetical protein
VWYSISSGEAGFIARKERMNWKKIDNSSERIDVSDANADMPRTIHYDSLSVKALALAVLMILFGVVFLFQMSYEMISGLHTQHVLSAMGQTAIGDISRSSSNRGGEFVVYVFSVQRELYSGQAEMKGINFNLAGDRNRILIRYLPNNPRINQPVKWQWVSIWDFFPFLLLLSITALGTYVILRAVKLRTLMRIGTVTVGRVTGCVPNKKLFTVYYEFTVEENRVEEGTSKLSDKYESGTSIPIIYLPGNPKRNYRFPVAGFTVAD